MLLVVPGTLFLGVLSGCAVVYTFVNSESKLDRLSPAMPKESVLETIGRPDLVLRDDGRVTVWQYNLNTPRQWLYELSLCPVSVWVGGCLFYTFTNWASERQREHAVHLILIHDHLCAWGPPVALMQKKKGCTGAATTLEGPAARVNREWDPVTTGHGPINSRTGERYHTMAVMPFADPAGVPGAGAKVSAIVTNLFLDLGIALVERARLEEVLQEQIVQLTYSDEAQALHVGRLAGAQAIVLGEVQRWEEAGTTAGVALSFRVIDVESGQLLFDGDGHSSETFAGTPDDLARLIAHRIVTRFGIKAGWLGTGRIGVRWEWRDWFGSSVYLVQEISPGSPADRAGLKIGDLVLACRQTVLAELPGEREAKRACQVEAGHPLLLDVLRGEQRLRVEVIAERRPGV